MQIFAPLTRIADNPFQRRQEYGDIAELAASIQRHKATRPDTLGLLQLPIGRLLFRNATEPDGRIIPRDQATKLLSNGRLTDDPALTVQLQFAHRRKRAFEHLATTDPDYAYMPVIIADLTDDQMLDGVWSENRDRRDLSAVEEAELLRLKLQQLGASQREVADAWGLSRPTVANRLRLLDLPPEVQQANRDGRLSERQCLALLPVVELQQAADTAVTWGSPVQHWGPPVAPAQFVAAVLEKSTNGNTAVTSDDIREYHKKAIEHAGQPLGTAVAKHDCAGAIGIEQPLCTGCPYRSNDTCLRPACLNVKQAVYGAHLAQEAAAELGYPYSANNLHFADRTGRYDQSQPLAELHAAGGCEHIVVGWKDDGWGARPFADRKGGPDYAQRSDVYNGGRAGIVLGHRGDIVPDCWPAAADGVGEKKEPEQTIPADLLEAWQKAGKKQMKQIDTAVTEAVTNQLRRALTDPLALAGIMSLGSWPQWRDGDQKDDPDTILKHLVGHMHSRGNLAYSSDNPFERHKKAVKVLTGGGLDPALLDIAVADDPRGVIIARALRIILHWKEYRHATWGNYLADMQPEIAACRREFERVGVMSDGAAELSMWLDIAARDVEKRLAAKEKPGTVVSLADDEDVEYDEYEAEDEYEEYDD